jgi:ketosteroid isomerase-like protein
MAESDVTAVREAYEALGRVDPGPFVELMDPDLEWIEPDGAPGVGTMEPGSGVYRGRDDVLNRMFGRLPTIWDNFSVQPERYLDAGDHVVVLGTLRANVPGSGAPAEAPFAHIYRMQGGKLVWWRCYEDTAMLHQARGVAFP